MLDVRDVDVDLASGEVVEGLSTTSVQNDIRTYRLHSRHAVDPTVRSQVCADCRQEATRKAVARQ